MTLQKRATLIASASAMVLALFKFIIGILSGSVAILASALDSILDLSISLLNYVALHNSEKPADEIFNYGRGKVEALASIVEGTIIMLSGFLILYESIHKIYHGKEMELLLPSILLMGISLLVTCGLFLFLRNVARITKSMVIKADALHYKSDLLSNGAILLSLLGILWFDIHILDALLGVVMAFYLGYSALLLIREGSAILLDRAMPKEIVQEICAIISAHLVVRAFHGLKTREAGNDYFVEVHLVFEPNIMLYDAHSASDEVELAICALDSTKRWNLTIHLDPYDDSIKRNKS